MAMQRKELQEEQRTKRSESKWSVWKKWKNVIIMELVFVVLQSRVQEPAAAMPGPDPRPALPALPPPNE